MAVKRLLERLSLTLKQIHDDRWLFLGGGAALVLFAVLTILAGAVRVPGERKASTVDLTLRRNVQAQSSSIEKSGRAAAKGNNSP